MNLLDKLTQMSNIEREDYISEHIRKPIVITVKKELDQMDTQKFLDLIGKLPDGYHYRAALEAKMIAERFDAKLKEVLY